jgi:hypothetical protein
MSAFPVSSFFSLNDFFVVCKNIIFKFLTPFCAFVYLAAAGAGNSNFYCDFKRDFHLTDYYYLNLFRHTLAFQLPGFERAVWFTKVEFFTYIYNNYLKIYNNFAIYTSYNSYSLCKSIYIVIIVYKYA